MVNTSRLKGIIAERNRSMRSVAREIGLSKTSFYKKMKTGQFSLREAEIISRSLQIEHPELIFFASDGT